MRPRWEWPAVIGMLLIAFFFRVWMLNDVPPGLHHDEVIIGQVAKDILRGHFGIYFTAGYGHEPLYHYLVAGMFSAIGANAFVLRLTSAFIAMLGLAATYCFIRLIFSPSVAIGTLAWMSISLWPVFFARVGLRGITLPLLTTLTAYFLWRALFGEDKETAGQRDGAKSRITHYTLRFTVSGILLGLTLYTYQASRIFPLIFAVFFVYLAITHRFSRTTRHALRVTHYSFRSLLRGAAVFFLTALIVAAPLIIYLTAINPTAEERVADLSGPLNQLRAGNPSEVIQSTLNTLGMFTYRGDVVPIYNVGGRPVFPEIGGAALFVSGLLICLWRWKRPAYALMLIWFFISLIPAMVTPFSPNFVRTIAAWPVPFVFGSVAMNESVQWVSKRQEARSKKQIAGDRWQQRVILSPRHLITAFFALVLVWNAALTANDYFKQWPQDGYVRFWQQAAWTQAVHVLNAAPSTTPIAASGLSIADFDPQTFDLLGLRSDLKVKWFDCRSAMLYPQEGAITRYLTPAYLPCDAAMQARFWAGAKVSDQPRWPDTNETIFTLQDLDGSAALNAAIAQSPLRPVWIGSETFTAQNSTGNLEPAPLPFELAGLDLLSWGIDQDAVKPGASIDLFTYWKVSQPVTPPLKIFIHVTAPDGRIVAQWDGLDVNVGSLAAQDIFVQRHRIELPADLPRGPYRISIGAYHPDSGARLKANFDGRIVDSIVLGTLTVQ